ncbi:MAG: tetratricopeptide repeat protein [Alphaproteobacteria bacterium]|jgi:predicted Zn-dependent protease|nr:tetratricopeptide repeat protein [Alphaproteobacteria bacterium]
MSQMARLGPILGLIVALGFASPEAGAAGGGGSSGDSPTKAAATEWQAAKKAIQAKNYEAAVPLLRQVVAKEPKNAEAYNYLGYAHARAGKHEAALGYYRQALAIKPDHRGANEYLGELHLKMGDLAAAEARLAKLDEVCFFGCAEYDLLKKAVQQFKATGKYTSTKGL